MGLLTQIFSRRTGTTVITAPRLVMLNLSGTKQPELLEADMGRLGPLFPGASVVDANPPPCDVLFIYGVVGPNGTIGGHRVRELIRATGASIVVVASENLPEPYMALARPGPGEQANLVMALDRKGSAFSSFFEKLFGEMFAGRTMPQAWVKLAPQIPGEVHAGAPDCIFSCERPKVRLAA